MVSPFKGKDSRVYMLLPRWPGVNGARRMPSPYSTLIWCMSPWTLAPWLSSWPREIKRTPELGIWHVLWRSRRWDFLWTWSIHWINTCLQPVTCMMPPAVCTGMRSSPLCKFDIVDEIWTMQGKMSGGAWIKDPEHPSIILMLACTLFAVVHTIRAGTSNVHICQKQIWYSRYTTMSYLTITHVSRESRTWALRCNRYRRGWP